MSTKDMIFNREADNRIYNGAVGHNTDGNCKLNDHAFCCIYLDAASVQEPTVIATTYDKITKVQTDGSAQKVSAVKCNQCRAVYLADDRVAFIYTKNSNDKLYVKVAEAVGTVFTLGVESADIFGGAYTVESFEVCAISNTQIAVICTCIKVTTSDPYICTIVFTISGMAVFTIGSPLEITARTSETITYDEFGISALDLESLAIVYYVDTTKNTYTVKIDLAGNAQAINQPPLLLYENCADTYPSICGLNTDLAFIAHNLPDKPVSKQTSHTIILYSGDVPESQQTEDFINDTLSIFKWAKISDGGAILAALNLTDFKVELFLFNIYGKNYAKNYTHVDAYFDDKDLFGIHKINEGEFVIFLDDYAAGAPTTYNIDANLISYLAGISAPTFSGFDEIDFGLKDVGSNSSETIVLQNDGVYPEEIDVSCDDFYFNDNDGLLSKSATIRVNGLFILCAEHYDYLKDPKGNVLQAVL